VLSLCDADKQKREEENWKFEELETMSFNQLKEMAMKRGIENLVERFVLIFEFRLFDFRFSFSTGFLLQKEKVFLYQILL